MSSLALTAFAGISSSALDGAFTLTTSQAGESTVHFGDGERGDAPPAGSSALHQVGWATGSGASGNVPTATPQPLGERTLLPPGTWRAEVGDDVMVAFAHGDLRRPFVSAPLWNAADKPPTSRDAGDAARVGLHGAPSRLDSMSEMGETESLRLQMGMDRLSKMMSTLSNLLQRIETTNAAITHNIK